MYLLLIERVVMVAYVCVAATGSLYTFDEKYFNPSVLIDLIET
jgi:hypothetical protein